MRNPPSRNDHPNGGLGGRARTGGHPRGRPPHRRPRGGSPEAPAAARAVDDRRGCGPRGTRRPRACPATRPPLSLTRPSERRAGLWPTRHHPRHRARSAPPRPALGRPIEARGRPCGAQLRTPPRRDRRYRPGCAAPPRPLPLLPPQTRQPGWLP